MTINIVLSTNQKETAEGFPLVVIFSQNGVKKKKKIASCHKNHFIESEQLISSKHPDYDLLIPILMEIKLRIRKIMLLGIKDIEKAYDILFAMDFSQIGFIEYAEKLIFEMNALALNYGKHNLKAQNKQLGNIKAYKNVLERFRDFGDKVSLQNLDYEILMRFRNYHLSIGNSKSTVHMYLRTLRSIYNKGILINKIVDQKPFAKVFDGLKTKSFSSRKKYLDKETIVKLEKFDLRSEKQKYLDLFLLQFYFGGCDLIDLYFLKKTQLRKGRIVFERTKTNTGTRIDLKIHPKAQKLIDKYKTTDGDWLFGWGKEFKQYETFRRTYGRGLIYIQELHEIEIIPDGGLLGSKVARHTFATIAKNYMIESDVIRELMGHERDEVDNFYKDKYPEKVRDLALFEIISSFECLK